jgi:hypothetical protein
MPNEGFLQRWSRLKAEPERVAAEPVVVPVTMPAAVPSTPAAVAPAAETRLPTLADVALLDAQSDYAAFVARGVDADVRRLAMKKLFADPHFNLGDGLDIYMGDYNVPSPVSPAMLASLSHARSVFARIDALLDPVADEVAPSISTAAPATGTPALPPPDQETA